MERLTEPDSQRATGGDMQGHLTRRIRELWIEKRRGERKRAGCILARSIA